MKLPIFKIVKYSRRTVILAIAAVVVLALGGTSALAAKNDAAPGSALYPFKRLWESGQMLLSFGPASKAKTEVKIAQDRVKAVTPVQTNGTTALTALQQAQQHLQSALTQAKSVSDSSQRKEIDKSISDAAKEAEQEAEAEKQAEASTSDKQNIQSTSDQIQQIQNQASSDD